MCLKSKCDVYVHSVPALLANKLVIKWVAIKFALHHIFKQRSFVCYPDGKVGHVWSNYSFDMKLTNKQNTKIAHAHSILVSNQPLTIFSQQLHCPDICINTVASQVIRCKFALAIVVAITSPCSLMQIGMITISNWYHVTVILLESVCDCYSRVAPTFESPVCSATPCQQINIEHAM